MEKSSKHLLGGDKQSIVHTEPTEVMRKVASYHRPKNGRWIADFHGHVSSFHPVWLMYIESKSSLTLVVLFVLQLRGVIFKKGNKDGTDMYALIFNGLGGKDLLNAPVAEGMPYGRHGNTIFMKTNVVNNSNSTKGRFPFGFQFQSAEVADAFEVWLTSITYTKNCFLCNAPSTLPLLRAAHAQADAATRSPPSKKVLARAKEASPDLELESPLKSLQIENLLGKEAESNSEGSDKSGSSDEEDVNYSTYDGSPIRSQYWY